MRIVLVGPVHPYRGGISHYTSMIAKAVEEEGHQSYVISFIRQYPKFLYPGKSDLDPSKEYIQVNAEYILDPVYPWTWSVAVRRIKELQPDIAIIQWWTTFWAPALAYIARSIRKLTKVMFLIHNVVPHEEKFFDRWLSRLALSQADYHVVQAASQKEKLLQLIPHAKPILVEHPVYDMFANLRIDKQHARAKLNIPYDKKVLLFFGIIRPYKGLNHLIEALADVKRAGYDPLLLIAGEFWEDINKYRRQIQKLELDGMVIIHNRYIPNEEVPIFFSAADIFVAPYTGGTQSGAVKIAAGFGLPMVVSEKIVESNKPFGSNLFIIKNEPNLSTHIAENILSALLNYPLSGSVNGDYSWKEFINQIIIKHTSII